MNAPTRPTQAQLAELYAWRSVALDLMPYMAAQLFALTPLNDPGVDTFAVDHRHRLYINFDHVIPFGPRFCGEALLHECSHLFGAHFERATDAGVIPEQRRLWGLCADFEINDDLRDAGCSRLAAHGVFAAKIGEQDYQTVEHYWAVLQRRTQGQPQQSQSQGQGQGQGKGQPGGGGGGVGVGGEPYSGCGSGAGGEPAPSELPDGDDLGGYARPATETEVSRTRIATAVTIRDYAASGRGTVPDGLIATADTVLAPPTVPWKAVVASVVRRSLARRAGDTDATFTRRNRRRHNVTLRSIDSTGAARTGSVSRIVYPGSYSPDPFIALVRDTSGSMSATELGDAASEIDGIARQCGVRGRQLRVLDTDSTVHEVRDYRDAESIVEVTGRGGTDMVAGVDAALALTPRPDLVIVVSDGFTPWPVEPHRVPLLICLVGAGAEAARADAPDWATVVVVDRIPTASRLVRRGAGGVPEALAVRRAAPSQDPPFDGHPPHALGVRTIGDRRTPDGYEHSPLCASGSAWPVAAMSGPGRIRAGNGVDSGRWTTRTRSEPPVALSAADVYPVAGSDTSDPATGQVYPVAGQDTGQPATSVGSVVPGPAAPFPADGEVHQVAGRDTPLPVAGDVRQVAGSETRR